MTAMASQITGHLSVCSAVGLDWQWRNIKGPRYCPLWGNLPVTGGFPHKGTVTRKMFSFDDITLHWNNYITVYEDVVPWKRFPYYWLFVRGISWPLVDCLRKGSVMQKFDISLMVAWTCQWTHSRIALTCDGLNIMWRHRDQYFAVKYGTQLNNLCGIQGLSLHTKSLSLNCAATCNN